jgi:UDP-3-O-[3-hydroxymyristoyl] glucosamine N-acyltransferase
MKKFKVQQIAELTGGELEGDGKIEITGLGSLQDAEPGQITFLADKRYADMLAKTKASAVILDKETQFAALPVIRVDSPEDAVGKILYEMEEPVPGPEIGVHPSAFVHAEAKVGDNVAIGPNVVIEKQAVIGDRTIIYGGTYIGHASRVGEDCVIYPGVVIREKIEIGNRVVIHPNAVIGADGFGYRLVDGRFKKLPQIGTVRIEDDVEIGACTCVDRAKFGQTVISAGTKIDNLVQVAHNVFVDNNSVIAAQTGIAGSSRIGKYVVMGGQVGVRDHCDIEDRVKLGAKTGVVSVHLSADKTYVAYPDREHGQALRIWAAQTKLPELMKRVSKLQKRVTELESSKDDKQRG